MAKKQKSPKKPRPRRKQKINVSEREQDAEALIAHGKLLPALEILDEVICSGTPTSTTWRLTGQALFQAREFAQAVDAFQHALEIDRNDLPSRFELAASLYQLGEVSESVRHYQETFDDHDDLNALVNLTTVVPGDPGATNQDVLRLRKNLAARFDASEQPITDPIPERQDGSRLRLGYVSAFFDSENYMKPVWHLINAHNRDRFEIHLFADDVDQAGMAWFERSAGDQVHFTGSLSNRDMAQTIREQQIDILIDLNAYSAPQRLPIYTHRLARSVAAWFNMYATSGLPGIDWIIGDPWVIPDHEETFYSERIARLPQSYLTFNVAYDAPEIVPPPCLQNGHITFGSLVTQYKITPQVIDAWAEILRAAPTTKLILANRCTGSQCNRDYVYDRFAERQINRDRIALHPPAEHRVYLKYYDQIDIALDAFPYNGGTTTMESIWQGVPVLTFNGDRWASRTSATLMENAGLGDFVTSDVASYVESAIQMAGDPSTPEKLNQLRKEMRERLSNSSVCDVRSMVGSFEDLLLKMTQDQ